MAEEIETTIAGERGQAATTLRDDNRLLKRGAVTVAVVAFIAFAFWTMRSGDKASDVDKQERVVIRQTTKFEPAAQEPKQAIQTVQAVPLPTPKLQDQAPVVDELLESARRAPVMAFGGGNRDNSNHQNTEAVASAQNGDNSFVPLSDARAFAGPTQGENEDQRFNRMLAPTIIEGSRAGHLGNRNYIVAMGTSIPCVLETALSSDQPGFASCVISRDVLSDNGRVVLMEKGTQIVGEYRGSLKRGQNRLFVLWSRAKTPTGVIVTLASPATDAIGRAGFDGYVDTHWWERFGSALLMSIIGDVTTLAGQQLQESDVQVQGTTGAGKDAAAIAVEQSINIAPTLVKHQGSSVSIFVARDLDFSGIYGLRVTEPRTKIYDRALLGDFNRNQDFVRK